MKNIIYIVIVYCLLISNTFYPNRHPKKKGIITRVKDKETNTNTSYHNNLSGNNHHVPFENSNAVYNNHNLATSSILSTGQTSGVGQPMKLGQHMNAIYNGDKKNKVIQGSAYAHWQEQQSNNIQHQNLHYGNEFTNNNGVDQYHHEYHDQYQNQNVMSVNNAQQNNNNNVNQNQQTALGSPLVVAETNVAQLFPSQNAMPVNNMVKQYQ